MLPVRITAQAMGHRISLTLVYDSVEEQPPGCLAPRAGVALAQRRRTPFRLAGLLISLLLPNGEYAIRAGFHAYFTSFDFAAQ